jgi:hypothetical protein
LKDGNKLRVEVMHWERKAGKKLRGEGNRGRE